jgi:hypothetical protein
MSRLSQTCARFALYWVAPEEFRTSANDERRGA